MPRPVFASNLPGVPDWVPGPPDHLLLADTSQNASGTRMSLVDHRSQPDQNGIIRHHNRQAHKLTFGKEDDQSVRFPGPLKLSGK
jgi:hypothetical protein